MPKFGSHIIFAEMAAQKRPDLFTDTHPEALRFGAIGPDTTLFMFDPATNKPEIRKSITLTLDILDTVRKLKEEIKTISEKLTEPVDDIADWLTGGLSTDLKYTVNAGIEAMFSAAKLGIAFGVGTINVKNPLFNLNPNMPADFIKNPEHAGSAWIISAADNFGFPFRLFGHPYTSDGKWKTPEPVGDYSNWWWMDLLHYRRTGEFASKLLSSASTRAQVSYARGYMTHVAGDICGHPFINNLVQGPFRSHAYRHLVVETLADTWLWDRVGREDILDAHLNKLIHLDGAEADEIAQLVTGAMRDVYKPPMVPSLLRSGYPDPEEFLFAYRFMQNYLRLATDGGLPMPQPPADTPREILEEMKQLLKKNTPGNFPKYKNDPIDFLKALFSWFGKGLSLLVMIATLPYAVIARYMAIAPRWVLYFINLGLFFIVSSIRTMLCLTGWGYCSKHDFSSFGFLEEWITTSSFENGTYPIQTLPNPKLPFYWLVPPMSYGGLWSPERDTTLPIGDLSSGRRPDWMIDPSNYVDLQAVIEFGEAVSAADAKSLGVRYNTRPSFGNAVDYSIALLSGHIKAYNFDLDGDRGYGYRGWEGYPPKDQYSLEVS